MDKNKVIKGFKGFDKDLTCRGFKYEEGGEYHTEEAKACESGFHFCENPIDIFSYYAPSFSIFREVEGSGKIDRHEDDSKVACTDIKIKESINLYDFINASVEFFFKRKYIKRTSKHSTGYSSASSATGDSSASICTGLNGKVMAGQYGCIALAWWNKDEDRGEMRCAATGCGDGTDGKLKADVWYRLDENGNFTEL